MEFRILPTKFTGERITIPIDFGCLLQDSTISSATVDCQVYKGEDPDPGSMIIGPVVIRGTEVRQFLGGGLGGVTYLLTYTVTTDSGEILSIPAYLAVLPYEGIARPIYVVKNYTTPPYPIYTRDLLQAGSTPLLGEVEESVRALDFMTVSTVPLTGSVRDLLQRVYVVDGELTNSCVPLAGTIVNIRVRVSIEPDSMRPACVPRDGTIRFITLRYVNWPAESLQPATIPLTGTIT